MASTSAREIGPAAAGAPAAGPGDADALADAGVPFDEGGAAAVPVVGATVAACLEPKMADTILPNTLMLSSRPYFRRSLPSACGRFPFRRPEAFNRRILQARS